jgi:hypothetical protein
VQAEHRAVHDLGADAVEEGRSVPLVDAVVPAPLMTAVPSSRRGRGSPSG